MRRRQIAGFLAGVAVISILLAGCDDGSPENVLMQNTQPSTENSEETASTVEEKESDESESIMEEILPQEPQIEMICDIAELSQEKKEAALEVLTTLYQNLQLSEYYGEAIHMITNEAWQDALANGLPEENRTYILRKEDIVLLSVQIGTDMSGKNYTNVNFKEEKDKLILLKQVGSVVRLTVADIEGNEYNGDFESWQIDSSTGEMRQEKGIYSRGVRVGEYTLAVRKGTGAGDAFDLWNMRENMKYKTTVTLYDEEGNEVKPEKKPSETKKPNETKKPQESTPPASEPAPPASEPEPPVSDSTPPASNPTPPVSEPTPPASNPTPPASPDEGDVDIEWSDDIM